MNFPKNRGQSTGSTGYAQPKILPPSSASATCSLRRPTHNPTNPLHINHNYPISQDTTGALLLARSRLQAREFQVQFKEREIEKTYLALVQAGKDAFPKASGTLRSVLVYDLDGRFDRVVPVKADVDKGKDTGRRGGVGDVRIVGKTVEAVTHWKLLGSSVRPLPSMPARELGLC